MKKLLIAVMILSSSGCKKISTPNEESKRLFGSWSYDTSFGGYSGAGGSKRFSTGSWVEFTEKGCFKTYEDSKKKSQKQFKIALNKSISDGTDRPALVYKSGDYDTYRISNDTLYLSDEAYDGYTYRFIRKT